jgi:outer membrane protein assembly factor BamB
MTDGRDRRSVLRAGVALCSVGLAGCVNGGGGGGNDEGPSNGTNETDGPDDPEPPEPEPVTSWPMQQYDAGNTAAVPNATTPTYDIREQWRRSFDADIRSSPVVADGRVYVRDRAGTVHAVGETGVERWTASVPEGALETTPAIYENLLLVPHDAGVIAFDREDGSEAWQYTSEHGTTDLAVADDAVFFADTHNGVHAVEAGTGGRRWRYILNESRGRYTDPPAIDDGTLYVPTTPTFQSDLREISAFDVRDREKETLFETEEYDFSAGLSITDGRLFAPTPGGIRAYDRNGGELWHYETDRGLEAGLAVTEDTAYGITIDDEFLGKLFAVDTVDGGRRWSEDVRIAPGTGPIIVGNRAIFGDLENMMVGYNRHSGELVWEVEAPIARYQQAAYANGQFYFGASNGILLAYSEP